MLLIVGRLPGLFLLAPDDLHDDESDQPLAKDASGLARAPSEPSAMTQTASRSVPSDAEASSAATSQRLGGITRRPSNQTILNPRLHEVEMTERGKIAQKRAAPNATLDPKNFMLRVQGSAASHHHTLRLAAQRVEADPSFGAAGGVSPPSPIAEDGPPSSMAVPPADTIQAV